MSLSRFARWLGLDGSVVPCQPLERRELLTVWETASTHDFWFTSGLPQQHTFGNIVAGQSIRFTAYYEAGPGAPANNPNAGEVWFYGSSLSDIVPVDDSTMGGGGGSAAVSRERISTGTSVVIGARFFGDSDPNDRMRVTLQREALADLQARVDPIASDGSVQYGYRVAGSVAADWRGHYVTVSLYDARRSGSSWVLTGDPLDRQTLNAAPGDWRMFTVSPSQLGEVRGDGTHLLAVIDEHGVIPEYNNANNIATAELPNVAANAPELLADGRVTYGYRVTTGAAPRTNGVLETKLYWASGPDESDIISIATSQPPLEIRQTGGASGSAMVRLNNRPANATHLITRVDDRSVLREPGVADNTAATGLPEVEVVSARLRTDGGIDVEIAATDSSGPLPEGIQYNVILHWSTSSSFADRISVAARRKIGLDGGASRQVFLAHNLNATPSEATHLIAEVTEVATGTDLDAANNRLSVQLPTLSAELATAPIAATAMDRVRLWLKPHQNYLRSQARLRGIDPRAIAGAIAYEAVVNTPGSGTFGPGKIHWAYYGSFPWVISFDQVAHEVEERGYLPDLPPVNPIGESTRSVTLTPRGAIRYIAAIMRAYADQAEALVDPLTGKRLFFRASPEVLADWYNGGATSSGLGIGGFATYLQSHPEYRPQMRTSAPPERPTMAQWVYANTARNGERRNRPVDLLLSFTDTPAERRRVRPRPDRTQTTRSAAVAIDVMSNDNNGDGDTPRAIAAVTSPMNGTVVLNGNGLLYTPNPGFVGVDSLLYSLSYDDGSQSELTPVEIVVGYEPEGPQDFRVVAVRPNEVDVAWSEVGGETHYVVQVSTNGGGSWSLQENVPANHAYGATLSVQPGQSYRFRVRAANNYGLSTPSNEVIVTAPSGAPVGLRTLDVRPTEVEIAWEEVSGESSYSVQVSTNGGSSWSLQENVPANHAYLATLTVQPDRAYQFRVVANYPWGVSPPSNTISVTTPSGAPSGLRVLASRPTEVEVAWNEVVGESSYSVQVSTNGGSSWSPQENVPANHAYLATLTVQPDRAYQFRVVANYPWGVSPPSNTVSTTTPSGAPSDLRVLSVGPTAVEVAWNEVVGESSYSVQVSTNGGSSWSLQENVPADHAYLATLTVQPSRTYQFRVVANYTWGTSSPSNVVQVVTPSGLPASPSNLRVLAVRPTEVDVAWDEVSGESSYSVQVSIDGGNSWSLQENVPADHGYLATLSVQPGSTYRFRVVANNAFGSSAPSNVVVASTPSGAPTNLRTLAVRHTEVDIAWNEVSGESGYSVQVSTNGGASWSLQENVPADHAYLATLSVSAGQTYQFRVVANYPWGTSSPSNVIEVTTPSGAPTGLRAVAVRRTEVEIEWNEVSGEQSYRVEVSTNGGSSWSLQENVPANHAYSATLSVQANRTYRFRVRAQYSWGLSAPSNVITVTTPA